MSLTGNGSKSIRRQDVKEQKSIAIGLKKLVMAHKATLGDTGINLTALSTPSEMSVLGFTNPGSAEILSANLLFYRNNLRIVSSHKGALMDYLAYTVDSSSRINFTDFTAEDGEIFIITYDDNAKNGIQMVDAAALNATGTIAIGTTDFNVGTPYEVNKYPTSQVGAVLVFRNGQIQFRNPSNGTTGGNYQEIDAGSGLGVIIRFNTPASIAADNILVVSNGLLAYRPDGSVLAEVENMNGRINNMIPTLAALAGVPETTFTTAPTNTDLKAFGDTVLGHETRIAALETSRVSFSATTASTTINSLVTPVTVIFTAVENDPFSGYNSSTGVYTIPPGKGGMYRVTGGVRFVNRAISVGGVQELYVFVNGSVSRILRRDLWSNSTIITQHAGSTEIKLNAGDLVTIRMGDNTTANLDGNGTANYFSLSKVD